MKHCRAVIERKKENGMVKNDDISLLLTPKNNGISVQDRVSGKEIITSKVIVVNGRITRNGSNIVGKTEKGLYYTPLLYWDNNQYLGAPGVSFFETIGNTPKILNTFSYIADRRNIVMPTLVSNADDNGPRYVQLFAYGEIAVRLANATRGSSVYVVGEPKEFWIGKEKLDVLWVRHMVLRKKGIIDELQ